MIKPAVWHDKRAANPANMTNNFPMKITDAWARAHPDQIESGAFPLPGVMRGLDPRIPVVPAQCPFKRDGRNKSGHDVCGLSTS